MVNGFRDDAAPEVRPSAATPRDGQWGVRRAVAELTEYVFAWLRLACVCFQARTLLREGDVIETINERRTGCTQDVKEVLVRCVALQRPAGWWLLVSSNHAVGEAPAR